MRKGFITELIPEGAVEHWLRLGANEAIRDALTIRFPNETEEAEREIADLDAMFPDHPGEFAHIVVVREAVVARIRQGLIRAVVLHREIVSRGGSV